MSIEVQNSKKDVNLQRERSFNGEIKNVLLGFDLKDCSSLPSFYIWEINFEDLEQNQKTFEKTIELDNWYVLKLVSTDSQTVSCVINSITGDIISFHWSKTEGLIVREEFWKENEKNPYFEWINYSSKYPQKIFEEIIINGRAKALESWKVEEVLKFFLPNGILKWTKDAWYLFGKNIWKYFEEFLALNPRWKFIDSPAIHVIGNNLIIATWKYVFELDDDKWWRKNKYAKYLFIIERLKGRKNIWKWGIRLLHSSFEEDFKD